MLVFGHATDALMDLVGLDAVYRERTGCSLYTVEAHVRYLREVPGGQELVVSTHVVAVDEKRVHFCHEMRVVDELVATEELLAIHVDGEAGRTAPLPGGTYRTLSGLTGAAPSYAGRAIALTPKEALT